MRQSRATELSPDEAIETRIKGLLLELEELPGWPDIYLHGGLLMRDVLLALGWSRERACHAAGIAEIGPRALDVTVIYGVTE